MTETTQARARRAAEQIFRGSGPAGDSRPARPACENEKEKTMHGVERPMMNRAGLPSYLTATLTLLVLLVLPGAARAQWATSGNNINNTNTGNVGVGTGASAPAGKLDVKGDTPDA